MSDSLDTLLPLFNQKAFSYYRRLRRVQDSVCTLPIKPLRLKEAAKIACLSSSYFSTFFSRVVGVPYSRWINIIRMRTALNLMAETNYTVEEIAVRSGFDNSRTFQRTAKKMTGHSPTQLKRIARAFGLADASSE